MYAVSSHFWSREVTGKLLFSDVYGVSSVCALSAAVCAVRTIQNRKGLRTRVKNVTISLLQTAADRPQTEETAYTSEKSDFLGTRASQNDAETLYTSEKSSSGRYPTC